MHSFTFARSLRSWKRRVTAHMPHNVAALEKGHATATSFSSASLPAKSRGHDGTEEDDDDAEDDGGVSIAAAYSVPPRSLLERLHPMLQFLHTLLVSTISTFPLIVTVIFWTALASPSVLQSPASAYGNLSVHAFNLLFTYLELLVLSRVPMRPWAHMPMCLVIIGLYRLHVVGRDQA